MARSHACDRMMPSSAMRSSSVSSRRSTEIDQQIGRTHDYTPLPEVGTTSTHVDDGIELPADDLSASSSVTAIPTRTVEPIKDQLEFWGPAPARAQAPHGV
jgi:hypothetical protein